jgi:hypothetical protein
MNLPTDHSCSCLASPKSGITCHHSTPEPVCALIQRGKSCFESSQDNYISVTGFKDPHLIGNLLPHFQPHPICRAPKPETFAFSTVKSGSCCIQEFGGKGWELESHCWKAKFDQVPQKLVEGSRAGTTPNTH